MRRLVTAAALLLVVASPAQALAIWSFDLPARPIMPEVESVPVTVEVAISCEDVFPFAGRLDYAIDSPAGVIIAGPTSQDVPACQSPQGITYVDNTFTMSLTREVPGLEQLRNDLAVHFLPSPFAPSMLGGGQRDAEGVFTVVADAVFTTEAHAVQKIVSCSCQGPVPVAIQVVNHGNVRTLHSFGLESFNGSAAAIVMPEGLVLDSPLTGLGPSNGTAIATVDVPASGQTAFTLRIDTVSAHDPSKTGEPTFVNFLVRNTGESGDLEDAGIANVPGIGPLAVLGILGVALVALRRRA